jgi:macrolide transport system ATP-binding/permease protein
MSRLSRFFNVVRRGAIDRELDEEQQFHLEARIADLMRDGQSREHAEAQARRQFGGRLRQREASRAVKLLPWLESVWQDLRYAARSLRRAPAFTAGATIALVIAIGLSSSVFTVFNAIALRPWPVHAPARVFTLFDVMPRDSRGRTMRGFSLAEYRYLRDQARTVSGLVAWRQGGVRLGHEEIGATTLLQYVSGNFFDALGVDMALGRGFVADEDRLGSPQAVAVLRHGFWVRQFGADRGILGRSIRLNDVPFTVVGVAAPEFNGTAPEQYELWLPLASLPLLQSEGSFAKDLLERADQCCSRLAGRLADGVTRASAHAELEILHRRFATSWGGKTNGVHLGGTAYTSQSTDQRDELAGLFAAMFGAVTLVLILACANVGNLMLARAMARQREIGIRLSIGASRLRVVRQLLTEGLLLSAFAAIPGLIVAAVLPSRLLEAAIGELPSTPLAPDAMVIAYTAGVSIVACLLFGLAPALRGTRIGGALVETGTRRPILLWWRRASLRGVLLSTQLAVSVVLLVAASLLVRGVQRAAAIDPGFRIEGVSVVSVSVPANTYDAPGMRGLLTRMVNTMRETPGLWPAGVTANVPLSSSRGSGQVRLPGDPESAAQTVDLQEVSPGYFDVLHIPIVEGRPLGDADGRGLLVNQSLARRLWPGQSAVGRVLVVGEPREVIGVVKDTYVSGLRRVEPTYYTLFTGGLSSRIVVGRLDPAGLGRLTAIAARLDPRITLRTRPLAWYADRWLAPARVGASLSGAVGLLALCLAMVGVFGVFAYMVEERRREIGIRMAIGARARHVVALMLGATSAALAGGLSVGIVLSLFATKIIEGYLYGASRFDVVAYAGVAGLLTTAALVATAAPVRRAVRIEPVVALRAD